MLNAVELLQEVSATVIEHISATLRELSVRIDEKPHVRSAQIHAHVYTHHTQKHARMYIAHTHTNLLQYNSATVI